MDPFFPHYLISKQTVDDRALNKDVLNALRAHLPPEPVRMVEVGAGIGTMLKRLVEWNLLCRGQYVLVDASAENIAYAREWIPHWATEAGLSVERTGKNKLQLCNPGRNIRVELVCADVFDFILRSSQPADVLVAHAFLDLLPLPESLERLLQLTGNLAWLTVNFDGLSTLVPEVDPALDNQVEWLYHATMDRRPTGGDSRTGRRLFDYLRGVGAEILAAGASDWVVYASNGTYPADEKHFLQFILGFFEAALKDCDELPEAALNKWLGRRYEQIERGELTYIAHQMDFLVRK